MPLRIVLGIIHIVVCLILGLLIRLGILKSSKMVMTLVWLLPLWGIVCLVVLEIRTRGNQEIHEEVGLEKLKINDEIYRSILMEEGIEEDRIVPLEEALLVNDTGTRRDLMMEIMYGDPKMYVSQLQEARMNDDTEVVHYAVTALTELQKEYDLKFQDMDKRMRENPEDEELLDRYLDLMEQYIGIGILEGNSRSLQMKNYSNLLKRKIDTSKEVKMSYFLKKIDVDLNMGEYESAYAAIETVLQRYILSESYRKMQDESYDRSWKHGIFTYVNSILYQKILRDEKCREEFDQVVIDVKENYLTTEKLAQKVQENSVIVKKYLYELPDKLYARVTEDTYNILVERMLGEVEENYQAYLNSLKEPWPFHILAPERIGEGLKLKWEEAYLYGGRRFIRWSFLETMILKIALFWNLEWRGRSLRRRSQGKASTF